MKISSMWILHAKVIIRYFITKRNYSIKITLILLPLTSTNLTKYIKSLRSYILVGDKNSVDNGIIKIIAKLKSEGEIKALGDRTTPST